MWSMALYLLPLLMIVTAPKQCNACSYTLVRKDLCLVHMEAPPRFYYWERTHLLGHHSSGRLAEYESLFLSEIIQFLIISLRSEKVWLLSTYSQVLWQWQLEKHKKANYFYTCQCNCVHSSAKTTFWDNR